MKNLVRWVAVCATVGLLAGPVAYAADDVTPPPPAVTDTNMTDTTVTTTTTATPAPTGATTVTVVKEQPYKFNVCYVPVNKTVVGSRMIRRCGPYGCQNIRVTREFVVRVNSDCHIQKESCSKVGYVRFGRYPTRMEARDAMDRCTHSVSSAIPHEWHVVY